MEENKEKIEELEKRIAEWQNELDTVWKNRNTDAAEVERRNLRNLISRSQKEIDELNGKVSEEQVKPVEETLKEIKDLKKVVEEEKKNLSREINILKNELEKLEEEKTIYESGKNAEYEGIYEEYNKKIEEQKKEIEAKEKALKEINEKMEKYYKENMDKILRSLTKGTQDIDKDIKDIEKQIQKKRKEIEEIEYGTEGALEEVELPDGTKTKIPKVNKLYEDIKKLEEQIKGKEKSKKEIENLIKEVKGEKENTKTEFNPEQNAEVTKFFHGQGDIPENTRDDRRGNDEYFGFEGQGDKKPKSRNPGENSTPPGHEDPQPGGPGGPEDPGPRGPGGPEDPGPGGPEDPGPRGPGENKSIAPLYWQVYNKVATEHVSSPERFMYNMSKSVIMPWNQDMSTPEKILSVVGTPLRAIGKGLGFISTKIMGTDKKYEKMREAVNNLSPEEFSILTDTKHEAEKRGVKKDDLDFEFTADTMRQYKHNTLALDAISERVDRETADVQIAIGKERERLNNAIKGFKEQLKSDKYTPEQKAQIEEQIRIITVEALPSLADFENMQVEKRNRVFQGKEHRTAKYKDTEGWIFGKFNPDNREENKTMEEFQTRYMEAVRSENVKEIEKVNEEWNNFKATNTRTVTIGSNVHNKISRGKYAVDGVKTLNMTQQTIGKQILANLAVAGIISHAITAIKNQKMVDQAVAANNTRIANANAKNSNISYQQTKNIDVSKEMNVDTAAAQEAVRKQSIVAGHTTREYGNLDQSAMENNGSWASGINTPGYLARDAATHQETSGVIGAGDLGSALKYYREAIKTYKPEMQNYANAHPNFDYSVLQAMDPNGLTELEDLFLKLQQPLTVTVNGVVQGTQVASMAGITLGKSYVEVAALLASQSGHFVSKRKPQKEEKDTTKTVENNNEKTVEETDKEPGE